MTKKTEEKGSGKSKEELEKENAAEEEEDEGGEEEEDEDEGDEEEEDDGEGEGDEEEEEDEEDEEDDGEEAVDAKPARRHRPEHDEGDHGAAAADDEEDSTWWAPHLVLGVLILLGILGFFGVFNKTLGFLAAKPPAGTEQPASKPETNKGAEAAKPPPQQPPQQAQPPREMFGAKHLLVMYKGSRRAPENVTRTKEEAKARAEDALKKAREKKAPFEELVKEYSDEMGAGARGGDLGKFPKGAMVPEFQAGLEKTKVGEVSDLVETPFGYHVILRTQ